MPEQSAEIIQDDFSSEYIASRTTRAEQLAFDKLLNSVESAETKQEDEAMPTSDVAPQSMPLEEKAQDSKSGSILPSIGRGIPQIPRGIAHGGINAFNEVIDLTKSLSDYMDSKFGTIDITNFEYISPEEIKKGKELKGVGKIPNLEKPDTAIGGMASAISQFLVGFAGAGKLKPFKAISPATKVGQGVKVAAQGAVADFSVFDPHEARLSDLVQSFPTLQNPVTEYLASDPQDSEAEGRFKNTIEGLGLGVLTEGFFKAVKTMRAAAIAKRMQADEVRVDALNAQVRPEIPEDAFKDLGDLPEELATDTRVSTPGQQPPVEPPKPKELLKVKEDGEVFINFARIDEPNDVKALMQEVANQSKAGIDEARRGAYKSFKQMEIGADKVDAWETLKARRTGEPLNAEQSVAVRNLWASSADRLTTMAKKAAETGNEADLFAFRKMMAIHNTIQKEVIAARTETARALASWRIPAGSSAEKFAQIDQVLMENGGTAVARDLAAKVSMLAESGMVQELDKFIEKSAYAKSRDALLEAWINGLLSGPKTHAVNMVSNTSVVFQQMYERKAAAKIAQFLGDSDSVQLGEAMAQYHGMVDGFKDAIRFAGKSFMTGESGFGLGKVELPSVRAISSESFGMANEGLAGRTVDVIGAAINIPTRSLSAADEFFKTIGYRMELNALALRKASQEVNAGKISSDQLKSRIAEIIENPPTEIKLDAIDQATYQTFTNTPGELTKLISKAKGKFPALNMILPFVRTPANIMNYTFMRTPLAPLFKGFRADIAAGGARRDLALARVSTGTTIMMVTADFAMNDMITGKGPSNASERQAMQRQGWQPYSVKVGDRYFAYNRLDPIGLTMGLSADLVEIMANDEFGPEKEKDLEELVIATTMAVANNAMSKTYLSGLSDFMQAMSDPERFGESFFQRLAGSAIPTGVAEIARFDDPYMTEVNSMMDAIRKRTPGLSKDLPARRNLWGEAITYQSGLGVIYDGLSPIYSKKIKPNPIDEAILEHEMNITMPRKKTSFDGVTVDLSKYKGAHSRYVELAGKEIKHPAWNLNSKDLLNEIVSGKHQLSQVYDMRSDGPDGGKYFFVRDIIQQFRDLAKQQLLKEYPEIKDEVDNKKSQKQSLKMPNFGG